jgi:hypothetical protein
MRQRRVGALLCAAMVVVGLDVAVVFARAGEPLRRDVAGATRQEAQQAAVPTPVAPPTEPPTTTTTLPPTTTTTTSPPPPARAGAWTIGPYQGTGVWLDVYDWTNEITGGSPRVSVDDIDRMADLGIQTIYIQTAHRRSAANVIEPERLLPMIDRAHARGMAVVAWYLPQLVDVPTDLRRLVAAAQLPVDGLGVDIEATDVTDPALRTERLLGLSWALRDAVGTKAISAITLDAVHLQVINPGFWPGFPWVQLGQVYDVIVPMSYWSVRKAPEWRQGERYTAENIDRIRVSTQRADMPIHVAGGIADGITLDDVAGMVRTIQHRGVLGGSLYDWNTSQPPQWDLLRALRVG